MENITSRGAPGISVGMRVFAIIAFLALAAVGTWGSIKVASAVPNAFSSLAAAVVSLTSVFIPVGETITLSAPSFTVSSHETFALSWEHAKKSTDGSYTFRYDCADGVHFTSPAASGSEQVVYCNVPFNFLNSGNSIVLTPVSDANRFIDVKLYIGFTPNGASRPTVTSSTTLTIVNEDISTSPTVTQTAVAGADTAAPVTSAPSPVPTLAHAPAPTKGAETSSTYPVIVVPPASNPAGYVDLAARIIEVGIVNKTTNVFEASSTPPRNPPGGRVAVRFAVENLGTKTSPQFDFNAVLPTLPSNIFSSPTQAALGPGDRIEFTLAFDSFADANEGVFTVNVDPTGRINEKNEDNNIVHYTIRVLQ